MQGERATFELKSETEESDGGYSDIEGFEEKRNFITSKVRKRKQRQPKPKLENFRPEEVAKREKEREEQYRQQQRELQIRAQEIVDLDQTGSEGEEEFNMANNLRWSVQNVSRFHGETGQSATQHLYEFDDFLKAARIEVPNDANLDEDTSHVINDFVTTLKGKARIWYDMNIPEGERVTKRHWNQIREKFKAYFHPLGSTKEQRIKAWKEI